MIRRVIAAIGTLAVSLAVLVPVGSAAAIKLPRTLTDARPAAVGVVNPKFPIDFVAAVWTGDHHDGIGAAVRFLHGSTWGAWSELGEDGAQAEGQFGTGLVSAGDADAYQVRGLPSQARVVAINTTDGPVEEVAELPRGSAGAYAACRSRADWGADESLMTWAPAFQPVQVLTVHHTATRNDDADPAATVRAIYRYHAVDRGWGDIGYQFLLDEHGVVYEGRANGATSRSCLTAGGDGSDFGHSDTTNRGVVGAHVPGWNSGNLGVSLLGTYTSQSPPAAQRSSLENVLATLASRHGINPVNTSYPFTNPANGQQKVVPTLSGHRDWGATECPGGSLYAALPDIRLAVAAIMAGETPTTTTSSTSTTSTSTTSTSTTSTSTTSTSTTSTTTAPGGIALAARPYKVKGVQHVDLTWSGATSDSVDVVRDGRIIATATPNDGLYSDRIGKTGNGRYLYQLCEAATSRCSSTVEARFT